MQNNKREYNSDTVKIIAHRGMGVGTVGFLENSILGFDEAIRLGANTIEFDIYVSNTGELLVLHEKSPHIQELLEENNIGIGDIRPGENYTTSSSGSFVIPTFKEIFDRYAHKVYLNIELKGGGSGKKVAQILNDYGIIDSDRIMIASLNPSELEDFGKESTNDIEINLNLHRNFIGVESLIARTGARVIQVLSGQLNPDTCELASKKGVGIRIWGANDDDELHRDISVIYEARKRGYKVHFDGAMLDNLCNFNNFVFDHTYPLLDNT